MAVGLLSAASLGFELLLLRWFAVLYWHHFAHMIISVALLGLGIAGSILTFSQDALLRRFYPAFRVAACGFALSLPVVVVLVDRIGFNPLEVVWSPSQWRRLALMFLVSAVPFVFSGFGIGLALRRFPKRIAVLYRADLAGAAAGALTAPLLMMFAPLALVLRLLTIPALTAASWPVLPLGGRTRLRALAAPLAVALATVSWPVSILRPVMSPYKDLPQAMRLPDVSVIARQVSPAGIAVALESRRVPFRYAPGLSMLAPAEPPEQIALFLDGHGAGAIDLVARAELAQSIAYLEWTTAALPYVVAVDRPRVLILGAGGGTDTRHARLANAASVVAVEASGALMRVIEDVSEAGGSSQSTKVMEPRTFLAATRTKSDVIQISPFGTAAPYADAAQAMRENYLYTLEGVRLMLRRLSPDGVLGITLALDVPPRAAVKLMATLATAAEEEGWPDPSARLAAVRSWNTVTLLVGRREFSRSQMDAVRQFCRERAFDLVWLPGMSADEANRYNVLDHPYYHEAARALFAGEREAYIRSYPFHVRPATDDRPYFGRFFRWRTFPEWWADRDAGAAPFLEWSYLLAWMLVAAALLLAVPLVGLPLRPLVKSVASHKRERGRDMARGAYFTALGLSFLLLEIVFIQKFVLFLGHPVVSMAVVVPAFLVFAGLGSGWSERFQGRIQGRAGVRRPPLRPVMAAVLILTATAFAYSLILPMVFRVAAGWPLFVRIAISAALIGGLAVWMGMPFPLGLKRLGESRPAWIPLAWGINGLASVLSAVGAGLLAMHAGFRMVTLVASLLYLAAAALEDRL